MTNLFNAQIESISLHKVGNISRNEPIFLSDEPFKLSDEITPLIKEFFLKPFREKEEVYYQFAHEVDMEYNEMYSYASAMFEAPHRAHAISRNIAEHLFEQSNHPHIKSGEVYVVHFKRASLNNVEMDAIGIFKSEIKSDFIEMKEEESHLDMVLSQGIALEKLDKGVLIFNCNKEEGYKILTVDSNRYDARYWIEHFLGLEVFQDENFFTKKYLGFCQAFGKEVVLAAEDKKEEIVFLNRAVDHFAKNDDFEENDFINKVIDNPDLQAEFRNFKVDKGEKYSIEDVSSFPISNSAVTEARKKIRGVIELDTNITIKLDLINPETADNFLEKGWDEEKQMYYYLCYYNTEK
jgi:hypothetical protein